MKIKPRPARNQGYTIWDFAGYFLMGLFALLMGLTAINFLFSMAFGGGGKDEEEPDKDPVADTTPADPSAPVAPPAPVYTSVATKKAYASCAACHGQEGKGMPGMPDKPMAPSLAGSEIANGDTEPLIVAVLKGIAPSGGYLGVMAGQEAILDDATLANALTHVRNSFDNAAGPVTAEQVAEIRAKHVDLPPMITREALVEIGK